MDKNVTETEKLQDKIREQIVNLAEPSYQQFSSKLLPGTERIVGVRLPLLRKMAKQIIKKQDWQGYLEQTVKDSVCEKHSKKKEELFE